MTVTKQELEVILQWIDPKLWYSEDNHNLYVLHDDYPVAVACVSRKELGKVAFLVDEKPSWRKELGRLLGEYANTPFDERWSEHHYGYGEKRVENND